jgi:phage terminase small subunit
MGTRGRPSMAALMVPENPTEIIQRPDAPYELTDEEADEWRAVVNTMPAGHFMRGNFALLSQYCRHVIAARRVAQLIEQLAREKDFNRKEFGALLLLQATESATITRLLRSMRLTQQSVLRAETTKHPRGQTRRPWDPE